MEKERYLTEEFLKISEMLNESDKQLRHICRNKAIEFLEAFLLEGEGSDYGVYTYSELLHAMSLRIMLEKEKVKVKRQGLKCLKCDDVIVSNYRHDFKFCKCGNIFIDGGDDYCRIGGTGLGDKTYKFIDIGFEN